MFARPEVTRDLEVQKIGHIKKKGRRRAATDTRKSGTPGGIATRRSGTTGRTDTRRSGTTDRTNTRRSETTGATDTRRSAMTAGEIGTRVDQRSLICLNHGNGRAGEACLFDVR